MKFDLEKEQLIPILSIAAKNSGKNDLIYLNFVKNSVELYFRSSLFDIQSLIMVENEIDHPQIGVNAVQLARICSQIPSDIIKFTLDHPKLKVSGGKSRYSLVFSLRNELIPNSLHHESSLISAETLNAINNLIVPFAAPISERALSGISFNLFVSSTEVVASNKYQLSMITVPTELFKAPTIIPAVVLPQLTNLPPTDDKNYQFSSDKTTISVFTKTAKLTSSIYPQPYFPYKQLFDKITSPAHTMTSIDKKSIKTALKNIRVFIDTKDDASKLIHIQCMGTNMTISSHADTSDMASEELYCYTLPLSVPVEFIIDINHFTRLIDAMGGEALDPLYLDQSLKCLYTQSEEDLKWQTITMLVQR